jgi:hypothetical protein
VSTHSATYGGQGRVVWFRCACGWQGPGCPTGKAEARRSFDRHLDFQAK